MKQEISQELEAHYNTSLVISLKEQFDILQSEVNFLREELREKIIFLRYKWNQKYLTRNATISIRITKKIKSRSQHHLNWDIPQPIKATSEKSSAKRHQRKWYWQKKSTMTRLITVWQTTSILIVGTKTITKITVITTRETVSIVMRATATVTTIVVAKKTTSAR